MFTDDAKGWAIGVGDGYIRQYIYSDLAVYLQAAKMCLYYAMHVILKLLVRRGHRQSVREAGRQWHLPERSSGPCSAPDLEKAQSMVVSASPVTGRDSPGFLGGPSLSTEGSCLPSGLVKATLTSARPGLPFWDSSRANFGHGCLTTPHKHLLRTKAQEE